jgi:hypothetical protein
MKAIHTNSIANIKYTTFETIIHIVLNFSVKPKNDPLIHDGSKNKVTKYVNIANIAETHLINHSKIVNAASAQLDFVSVAGGGLFAKTLSPNTKYITAKKPR